MYIYLLYFVILLFGSIANRKTYNTKWTAFMAIVFGILIGFRHIAVGTDTLGYCHEFIAWSDMDWSQFQLDIDGKNEPLYSVITWSIGYVFSSYTMFLLFWGAFISYAVYYIQKKEYLNGREIAISYLSLFLIGLFSFFVAGIRQTFALSAALFCWQYLKEPFDGKWYKDRSTLLFLIVVAVSYQVHNSILLFAIIYPFKSFLQNMKIKGWYIIPLVVLYFVGSRISFDQINEISAIFFNDRYAAYSDKSIYDSSWSASAYIMQLILFMVCFLVHKELEEKDKSNTMLMNLALIALVFQSMAGAIAEMARLAYYFNIFYVILLPRALSVWEEKFRGHSIYVAFYALSFFYLFFLSSANLPEYKFFWQ